MSVDRRGFLQRAVKYIFGLMGLAFLMPIAYLYPSTIKRRRLKYFTLIDEDDAPRKGIKQVELSYELRGDTVKTRIFLVRESSGGLLCLSPVCSHLGCLVNWDWEKGEFRCPCHGGRYNMVGKNIGGPPPRPLERLPNITKGGIIQVGLRL